MRPVITMTPGIEMTRALDRLAADPEGWSHPTNRALARAVPLLRGAGIPDDVIYAAVLTAR